jgi:cell division protein FtsW (lipid II flippase)
MLVMSGPSGMLERQRTVSIACAMAATCLGVAYLAAAGAPASRSVINGVAFLLGVVALVGIGAALPQIRRHSGPVLLVMGLSLVATALLGAAADGASRWIMIGPLSVQVSLVLVPFMAVTFARYPTLAGCLGIAVAALALALQPDRAMSGVLAFGMAVLAIARPSRLSASALMAAIAAFLLSMMRPDNLPAVPYVDQILFTAFEVHILAGAAVWLGVLLLLVPPILGWRGNQRLRHAYSVSGAVWLGCIAAAALGNYPTPVVGYGGSAILGYLLSLSLLPPGTASVSEHAAAADGDGTATGAELHRSAALA